MIRAFTLLIIIVPVGLHIPGRLDSKFEALVFKRYHVHMEHHNLMVLAGVNTRCTSLKFLAFLPPHKNPPFLHTIPLIQRNQYLPTLKMPPARGSAWSDKEKVRSIFHHPFLSHLKRMDRPTSITASTNLLRSHADLNQIALLVSIIRSSTKTTPDWKNVALPEGRTLGTSQKIYGHLVKDSEEVKMASGDAIPPPTPKAAKKKRKTMKDETEGEDESAADSEPIITTPTKRSPGTRKAASKSNPSPYNRTATAEDLSDTNATPILSKKRGKQAAEDSDQEYALDEKPAKKAKKGKGVTRDESVAVVIGSRKR